MITMQGGGSETTGGGGGDVAATATGLVPLQEVLLPVGFRFQPEDFELIDYYLRRRLAGQSVPGYLIREADVYQCEPWNLIPEGDFFPYRKEESEMYFFTPRSPASSRSKGSKANRRTAGGGGLWDGRSKDTLIKNASGDQIIGHRVQLTFKLLPDKTKTNWIMHEYRLHSPSDDKKFDELVLCRIFNKKEKAAAAAAGVGNEEEEQNESRLLKRQQVEVKPEIMSSWDDAKCYDNIHAPSSSASASTLAPMTGLVAADIDDFDAIAQSLQNFFAADYVEFAKSLGFITGNELGTLPPTKEFASDNALIVLDDSIGDIYNDSHGAGVGEEEQKDERLVKRQRVEEPEPFKSSAAAGHHAPSSASTVPMTGVATADEYDAYAQSLEDYLIDD